MKLLAEITDETLGIGSKEVLGGKYILRKSGRVILLREDGLIAAQFLRNHHFHKLPGGGVEKAETPEEAAVRETWEEVGCQCEILSPLGIVIEYREKYSLLHISYGFVAKVTGDIGVPIFESDELEAGQENVWIEAEALLKKFKTEIPTTYEGKFNQPRELAILEEFLRRKKLGEF